jgi:hypothetical protein
MSNAYKMESNIRSYCLLLNNYFTYGTHKQMVRFRNIFSQLGFNVKMKKNLSAENIRLNLLLISKDLELHKHNAFIFMIISHGYQNREIFGFDRKPFKI